MSYDTTRDAEQLNQIEHAIDDFIVRYNNSNAPASARQTVFLLPGGMASRLKRAKKAYKDSVSGVQTFTYDDVWLTPWTFVWPRRVSRQGQSHHRRRRVSRLPRVHAVQRLHDMVRHEAT